MDSSPSPSLAVTGSLQQPPLAGSSLGVSLALYPQKRLVDGTRELKHTNDLTERQKYDRNPGLSQLCMFPQCIPPVWVLGAVRREKDATGPQCPFYDAVGGLSESQGSVLQTGPIKYQFDPTLVDVERATLLACDIIDIYSSRMSLAWMIPQVRTTEKYFVKIQYVDKFLIFSGTDKDSHLELIGKLKQCFGIYNGVCKCLLST